MQKTISLIAILAAVVFLTSCNSQEKKPAPGTVNKTSSKNSTVTRSPARSNQPMRQPTPRKPPKDSGDMIRKVVCVYDQKPWLNLDTYGDRNPEGIKFRAFLDAGAEYGVLREGTIHVDMYKITHVAKDQIERTLVSDWHYPTSEINKIKTPGMLGEGYFLHLVWADKDIAGSEVEIIVRYEDPQGNEARSGTKRLTVPKYST